VNVRRRSGAARVRRVAGEDLARSDPAADAVRPQAVADRIGMATDVADELN
jgi:hypothetical protein